MKNVKKLLLVVGIFLSMGFFTKHIFADTTDIIVTPIQPANQLSDVTYFDLLVRSDTNQKLQMNVKNTTNKAINVNLKPLNSFTNNNGLITYNEDKISEENNGISFTNLVKEKNQTVQIPSGETISVTFEIDISNKSFPGEIMGAFQIEQILGEVSDKVKKKQTSLVLENKYQMVIGVRLRQNLTAINPVLHLKSVKPIVFNGEAATSVEIQNNQPIAFGGINIQGYIENKKSEKVGSIKLFGYQMAPNSRINLPINFDEKTVESGDYTLFLKIISQRGEWIFEKQFTLTKLEVDSINRRTIYSKKYQNNRNHFYILLFIILLLLVIILILVCFRKKTKNEKEE